MNMLFSTYEPINICLVGAGRAGEFHINSLNKSKLFNLICIIDFDLDKASNLSNKYYGKCQVSDDLDFILESYSNINAFIIASSTQSHYTLSKKCLQKNKHVFCEKPLGNADEMKELYELALKNNIKLLVGYQKRFDPEYQTLYNKIKNKNIMNIRTITRDNPIPPLEYLKTSGGIVEDMLSHDIDIVNQIMNNEKPNEIECMFVTNHPKLKEIGEIENIDVLIKYQGGQIVTLNGSRTASYGYDQRMEVQCQEGLFMLNNKKNDCISEYNSYLHNEPQINYSFKERYQEAYFNELIHFYKVITKNINIKKNLDNLLLNKYICNQINTIIEKKKKNVFIDTEIKENEKKELRNYKLNTKQYELYKEQHLKQTYDSVKLLINKYKNLDKREMYMYEALDMLDNFIDPSDPDVDLPNSVHAYQTAERIRKMYPLDKQLQVTGLIHDLGKVLFDFGEPSHNVVGDTFVLGCEFPSTIVYYDTLKDNPDYNNEKFSTKYGIYEKNCGLDNLRISFGHDEYLYMVLKGNTNHKLDQKYLNIIRYHSFYPWHTHNSYKYFMNTEDITTLLNVKKLNEFDLYSKEDVNFKLTENIREYYAKLLEEYFPEKLKW